MVRRKGSESPFAIYYWLIQVLIVLSITAVVIWLSTRPRIPELTITNVYIPETGHQNLSKVQETEPFRNNSIVFVLEITNPNNGMTICYVDINMILHDGGVLVGNKSVGSFCQGHKKTVTEEVLIVTDQQFRGPNVGGGESLRVTVETIVKYHVFKWKTRTHHMGYEGFVRIGNVTENIHLHKTSYILT